MSTAELSQKYDRAAPAWGDKMRLLGYHDAYLGFLADSAFRSPGGSRVLDIGCGTGAFADAWAAIHGPEQHITLLDPSPEMLRRADATLAKRGVNTSCAECLLEDHAPAQSYDTMLAAHVIEHVDDPAETLAEMRKRVAPGGQLWLVVSKPHWCNAIIWLQWRHRSFRPEAVRQHLAHAGWTLEQEYAFPSGPPSRTSRGYVAVAT